MEKIKKMRVGEGEGGKRDERKSERVEEEEEEKDKGVKEENKKE